MKNIILFCLMAGVLSVSAQENATFPQSDGFRFDPESSHIEGIFQGTPDSFVYVHAVECNATGAGCKVSQTLGTTTVTVPLRYSPGQTVYVRSPGNPSQSVTIVNFDESAMPMAIIFGMEPWILVKQGTAIAYIAQSNLFQTP